MQTAQPLNTLIQPWAFLDDSTLLMKSGAVAVIYRIEGVDYEGTDAPRRQQVVDRFLNSLKPIDPRFRLTEYLVKRRLPPFTVPPCPHPVAAAAYQRRVDDLNGRLQTIYTYDLYMVLLAHGPEPALFTTRSREGEIVIQGEAIRARVKALHHLAQSFETALADVIQPTRLDRAGAFAFLEQLVNVDPQTLGHPLRTDRHLDCVLPKSAVTYHSDHIQLGAQTVKILTMQAVPGTTYARPSPADSTVTVSAFGTYAHLLQRLDDTPGEWIACLDAQRVDRSQLQLWMREKYYNLASYVTSTASASQQHLAEVERVIEHDHRTFWHVSLTLMVHDRDPKVVDAAVATAIEKLGEVNGTFIEESGTINARWAWLAMVPGNSAYNVRAAQLPLTDENLGALSFLFRLDRGERWSTHLNAPPLMVFETEDQGVYSYNLHHRDVGHTLIVGSTGSGKTVLANSVVMELQKYDPTIVIFDIGPGYRKTVAALDGGYLALGLSNPGIQLNPFAGHDSPEQRDFAAKFVEVLLEGHGAPGSPVPEPLSSGDKRDIYQQVEAVYAHPPGQRRLSTMLLSKPLQKRLQVWLEGNRYPLFDHAEDTLTFQRLQAFNLAAMRQYPEVLNPLLLYVFHRFPALIGRGLFTIIMDELWMQIQHPILAERVLYTMKTGRKDNVSIILVTQSLEDFAAAGLLPHVLQNCHNKLILADPAFGAYREIYGKALQLNEAELDLAERLIEKQQILIKRPAPKAAKVVNLRLPRVDLERYTPDPIFEDMLT